MLPPSPSFDMDIPQEVPDGELNMRLQVSVPDPHLPRRPQRGLVSPQRAPLRTGVVTYTVPFGECLDDDKKIITALTFSMNSSPRLYVRRARPFSSGFEGPILPSSTAVAIISVFGAEVFGAERPQFESD
jgi:hypothetical protein